MYISVSIDCSFLTDTAPQIQVKITPYNYVPGGSYNGKIYISKVFNNAFDFTKDVVSPGMPVRVSDENDVDPQVISKQVVSLLIYKVGYSQLQCI